MRRDHDSDKSSSDQQRQQDEAPDRTNAAAGSDPVEAIHAAAGNQAVKELHENGRLQPKLDVSQPGDPQEREAERIADQVLRRSTGEPTVDSVQRSADTGGRASVDGETEHRIESLQGGGKPLSESARSFFEPRFGRDFSDVRVHTGPQADRAARSINAEAFTVGTDIAFASGNYDPQSEQGKELMAHELTHVVQQGEGTARSIQRQTTMVFDEEGNAEETMIFTPEDVNQETMGSSSEETTEETMEFTEEEAAEVLPDDQKGKTSTIETEDGEVTLVAGPPEVEDTQRIEAGPPEVEEVAYVVDREVLPNGTVVATLQTPDRGKMKIRNGPAYRGPDFRPVLVSLGMPKDEAAKIDSDNVLVDYVEEYNRALAKLAQGSKNIFAYKAYNYIIENSEPVRPATSGGGQSSLEYENWKIGLKGGVDLENVEEGELTESITSQLAATARSQAKGMLKGKAIDELLSGMVGRVVGHLVSVVDLTVSGYKEISHNVMLKNAVQAFSEADKEPSDREAIRAWRGFVEKRLKKNMDDDLKRRIETGETSLERRKSRLEDARQKLVDEIDSQMGDDAQKRRGPQLMKDRTRRGGGGGLF